MNIRIEKIKRFVKKHKTSIMIIGGTIIGITVTVLLCKLKDEEYDIEQKTIEKSQQWTDEWKEYCDKECLLYENGLPIFANDEQTIIYRDAIHESADINHFIENGFEIIDRV